MKTRFLILVLLGCFFSAFAQVNSQWRGANRDGIYQEKGLLQTWSPEGPTLLWTADSVGNGYSSVVTDGTKVYVTGINGNKDQLTAFDKNGKKLWQTAFGPAWDQSFPETRTTPTIENSFAYAISGKGTIVCVNTTDGSLKWSVDAFSKFESKVGEWGTCESPLIVDNKLFYTPGGSKTTMVALDKNTGETIWQSESLNDNAAYVSPIAIQFAGKTQIVNLSANYLFAVDASNGKILWKYEYGKLVSQNVKMEWPTAVEINTNTPYYHDGFIYVTGGYDHVGAKLKLADDGNSVSLEWLDDVMDVHHGGFVLVDGYLYGSNWLNNADGNWCCIDWKTGKKMYDTKWNCKGSIVSADGLLYCMDEKRGEVALVKPSPNQFEVISKFKPFAGGGPFWAHPYIDNGILYLRKNGMVKAYNLKNN